MRFRLNFSLVVIVVVAMATACGNDPAAPSHGSAVVTLDAFSGLPNPTWMLDDDQAAELLAGWKELPATTGGPYPGTLGYRGVIIDFADGSRLVVADGVAIEQDSGTARADTSRDLERQILETGHGTVDPTLLDSILAELTQG
jgi:hypothetical protein